MSSTPDDRFAALVAATRAGMARYHVPGVALGLIDGAAEHVATLGVTRLDQPQPVDGDTRFQIASITKTVVATAVLRLVERGRLALDRPLRDYVPQLRLRDPAATDRLTMTHLLTHTGGFAGDFRDGAYGVQCGAGDDALARLVTMLAHLPAHALPGEVWAYNNNGFGLAGRVIEVVTGQTFEQAIAGLVLRPLSMRDSAFLANEPPAAAHVAMGHRVTDRGVELNPRWTLARALNPAGGLVCTPGDLLRFARFHLGDGAAPDGERLLSAASMALMQAPRVADALHNGCLASFADEVGLSWFSRATAAGRLLTHGGWTSLALRLTLLPARRLAVFVLTNADLGAQLHAEVTKQALRDYAGIDGLDPIPLPAPPAPLEQYGGTYRFTGPDQGADEEEEVQLAGRAGAGGNRLTVTSMGPAAFYAPDRIAGLEGLWRHERGHFLCGPDGAVDRLRLGGRIGRRLT